MLSFHINLEPIRDLTELYITNIYFRFGLCKLVSFSVLFGNLFKKCKVCFLPLNYFSSPQTTALKLRKAQLQANVI